MSRLAILAGLLGSALGAARLPAQTADLILTGGRVATPSGWAQAVAIQRGVIVAVGDASMVARFRGPQTRVVALGGKVVLPGLHDVHVHPLTGGLAEHECKIPQGSSLEATKALVRACAAKVPAGAWVVGGQWDAPALGGVPDRSALDQAAPNRPVLLHDTSGHSSWVSSQALRLAGIDRTTKDPPGGVIERDSNGEPTGVLRESAAGLVEHHVPPPTKAALRSALEWSVATMAANGITSYTDAAIGFVGGEAELETYAALADAGRLPQRVTLCLQWAPGRPTALIAARNRYRRPNLAIDCVKIFLDGVPTDGHTAAMLEPYASNLPGRDDEASRRGMLLIPQAELDSAVTQFDRMGLTVKFHAAGDAAVRAGLDAIAAARRANGWSGLMHHVGHCTFVAPEDIARARSIGATFEVSPYLWGPSPINDAITAAVGPALVARVWPVREMLEAGALVVPGSDWSVVPSVNPWIGIETLVTRQVPGGSPNTFGGSEAISVHQAIDLFTDNSARQERRADRLGRIEVGLLADLIVVDLNPYEIPPTRLHETKVLMTFVDGRQVFSLGRDRPAGRPKED